MPHFILVENKHNCQNNLALIIWNGNFFLPRIAKAYKEKVLFVVDEKYGYTFWNVALGFWL